MRRFWFLFSGLLLCVASVAWAQQTPGEDAPLFTPYRQIGERRPQGILYEANNDRFAWVDLEGRLTLVDAATYQTEHILYEQGAYNAYRFSHDGRWLALAIDRRIELWNTETGELSASFEPSGANLVQGPLHFTPDDHYLLLDTVVPAPQELRRSENDTSIIPWLWDLVAARGEAPSRFVSAEDGYPFFNFRNGLVVGANTTLIAGIPNRLQVIDGTRRDFPVTDDIQAQRAERDPITVWESASDDLLYVDPNYNRQIVQVNPETGDLFYITPGNDISSANIDSLQDLSLSNNAQILCGGATSSETSLLRLIYGSGYLSYQNYEPLTITLLDVLKPMTMAQDRGALLLFSFNEQRGRGVIDLIRPQDVQQMVLSPDRTQLMIRRASGSQPIELYDLSTCTLERTITQAEPDEGGQHTLAYNATGDAIVSDFQRFDAHTGESLAHEVQYTSGFEQFTFSDDSQRMVTTRNNVWQSWDIETGQPLESAPIVLHGEILDRSPDASRYLTRTVNDDGSPTFEIVDIRSQTRRSLDVSTGTSGIDATYVSEDWEKVLVVYTSDPLSQHYPGNEIAVYQFGVGELLRAAGDDLPPLEGRQYGWLDERTIYVASYDTGYYEQPERVYGVDYDASGLPACLIDAYPNDYTTLLPIWDVLTYRLRSDQLAHLAQRLCAETPANAEAVVDALTPTPPFYYRSESTPLPYNIPGVPECLTSRFASRAIDYAALWREITTDLDEAQTAEIETMICEGLISSVGGIQATPTINPNLNVPPTPTPIDSSPQTTAGSDTYRLSVIAIDIETQQRTQGDYIPPIQATPARNLSILYNLYNDQFHRPPNQMAVSPDGHLAAEFDNNNFIRIYRLSRSNAALMDDETNAVATRAAQSVHSIGLLPTPTDSFSVLGEIRPTLTPTVSPTAPPLAQTTPTGWDETLTEDICPASQLYTVENPPPDFAVSGRLFALPEASNVIWVLDPVTGRIYADPTIPRCVLNGSCRYSFDQMWMVRDDNGVIVSHPDGSEATELIPPGQTMFLPSNYIWQPDNTLLYSYSGYMATAFPGRNTLLRTFDPATGILSEPFLPAAPISIDGLPTSIVSTQPGGSLVLASTPFGVNGARFYIYDRETEIATYFARTTYGGLDHYWHPLGSALYYSMNNRQNRFDVATGTHQIVPGGIPEGTWSRDGRYRVAPFVDRTNVNRDRIEGGDLPLKLDIWDSETGAHRRYCLPETGYMEIYQPMYWSPDSRYLAFTTTLPLQGDYFPTPGPTAIPYTPQPTMTPVPLDAQYDYQFPRTLVLDTQTGYVTILSTEIQQLILWTENGGAS